MITNKIGTREANKQITQEDIAINNLISIKIRIKIIIAKVTIETMEISQMIGDFRAIS